VITIFNQPLYIPNLHIQALQNVKMFSKALLTTALISAVSAHQNFHQLWINDETPGYQTGIRMPPSNSPVEDVTSNNMACNVPSTNGVTVETLDANAGDSIKVQWDQSGHPGPITHFLKAVDDASTNTGVGAGWFKIDELNAVNGKWANEIMGANNMTHEFKLPTGLASGQYLVRLNPLLQFIEMDNVNKMHSSALRCLHFMDLRL
jgi:cellulase